MAASPKLSSSRVFSVCPWRPGVAAIFQADVHHAYICSCPRTAMGPDGSHVPVVEWTPVKIDDETDKEYLWLYLNGIPQLAARMRKFIRIFGMPCPSCQTQVGLDKARLRAAMARWMGQWEMFQKANNVEFVASSIPY